MADYIESSIQDVNDSVHRLHRESTEQRDQMSDQLRTAFRDAQESSAYRYQALQELTNQMKIGQAIQVIQYGMDHNQFYSDSQRMEMQDLYAQLGSRIINDAKKVVGSKNVKLRGSEFDGMFDKDQSQSLDAHVLD